MQNTMTSKAGNVSIFSCLLDSISDDYRPKIAALMQELQREQDPMKKLELAKNIGDMVWSVSGIGMVEDSGIVVDIESSRLSAGSASSMVREARDIVMKKFHGITVTNKYDGSEILLTSKGLGHGLSSGASKTDAIVSLEIPLILENAIPVRKSLDRKGREDIKAAFVYGARISIDGSPFNIGILVREHQDGKRYYDHFELKVREPLAGRSEVLPSNPSSQTATSSTSEALGHGPSTNGSTNIDNATDGVNTCMQTTDSAQEYNPGIETSKAGGTLEKTDEATYSAELDDLTPVSMVLNTKRQPSDIGYPLCSDPGAGGTLDAVSPLERIKLSGQLSAAIAQMNAAQAPLDRVKAAGAVAAIVKQLGVSAPVDDLSDDPNADNYRYKDTGYIADSRKEKAAEAITVARKTGQRVVATSIDFSAIEQNPRQAAELITKQNLFGKTDWTALQESGMEPAAGFLIDKIYASIGPKPSADNPQARKDYAIGLQTIRDRLEPRKTVAEVMDVVDEIRDELNGVMLNADESEQYELMTEQYSALRNESHALDESTNELYNAATEARTAMCVLQRDIESRKRRKWTVTNEALRELQAAEAKSNSLWNEFSERRAEINPKTKELDSQATAIYRQRETLMKLARARNLTENQTTRSWLTFGESFFKLLHFRRVKNSSFAGHVTNARVGKVADWSWADKSRPTKIKEATQQEISFQLKVADSFDRKGGKPVDVSGTKALEEMIGFRAVQSGNWVLKDPNSAKFHVEQTAAAMSDLSDVLGVPANMLGFDGRLGMAFGARGNGSRGSGAAHYEPVHRVINLTKMGGGGALAHEWFHSMDNIIHEMVNEKTGAKDEFVTANPDLLPPGPLRDAVSNLYKAIHDGDVVGLESHKYTGRDVSLAKYNVDNPRNDIARAVKNAGNAAAAVKAVDAALKSSRMRDKDKAAWRRLAVAYYHDGDASRDGKFKINLRTGYNTSSFAYEAMRLDGGERGKYWSQTEELSSRAFQSYIEDKLSAADRRNDYLSALADNKHYEDGLFGPVYPFPDGEERKRINAAFDKLFAAVRDEKVFEKAIANKPLMDSIFATALDSITLSDITAMSESAIRALAEQLGFDPDQTISELEDLFSGLLNDGQIDEVISAVKAIGGDIIDELLDSVSPLDRIRLSGQIAQAIASLNAAKTPLDKVRATGVLSKLVSTIKEPETQQPAPDPAGEVDANVSAYNNGASTNEIGDATMNEYDFSAIADNPKKDEIIKVWSAAKKKAEMLSLRRFSVSEDEISKFLADNPTHPVAVSVASYQKENSVIKKAEALGGAFWCNDDMSKKRIYLNGDKVDGFKSPWAKAYFDMGDNTYHGDQELIDKLKGIIEN